MTFQIEFIAALTIGFFGSLHCVGMCGPIALASPSLFPGSFGRMISGLIYNSGRIITYMGLGLLIGLIGKGVYFFQWQQWISIIIGILIVLSSIAPSILNRLQISKVSLSFVNRIKQLMGKALRRKTIIGILSIGLVNGLLPCGLVYIGLAGSLDQNSAEGGALFMAFFGIGTIPMMTGVHLLGNNLKSSFKNKLSKALPYFIFIMGLIFILRGLGLGIPYLSPSMDPHTGDIMCTSPAHRHFK